MNAADAPRPDAPYGRCPCGFWLKPDGTCPFCDTEGPQ